MERSLPVTVVLVDGWNLLVRLAGAPEALADPETREEARLRLLDLLEAWAEVRRVRVVVAWDGPGPAVPPAGSRVRSVGIDPPAEADDWIVHEAARLRREGTPVRVVTRDRDLLARVSGAATALPPDELASDLRALAGEPVRAPHLHGPGDPGVEIPAGPGPVDPARLPRRRPASPPGPPGPDPPAGERNAAPSSRPSRPGRTRDSGDEARRRERKERKRARWERARRRRNQLHHPHGGAKLSGGKVSGRDMPDVRGDGSGREGGSGRGTSN